jgi:hypothetical protein
MPSPRVYDKHHGDAPAGAVYIGRGSPYGNRFVIDVDGNRDHVCNGLSCYSMQLRSFRLCSKGVYS